VSHEMATNVRDTCRPPARTQTLRCRMHPSGRHGQTVELYLVPAFKVISKAVSDERRMQVHGCALCASASSAAARSPPGVVTFCRIVTGAEGAIDPCPSAESKGVG
jgi:hypothetical protein